MTPDPIDAALDVWFGNRNWRSATPPETKDNMRARMRRVLDAHDAGKAKPNVVAGMEALGTQLLDEMKHEDNTLPMDALPEGWGFTELRLFHNVGRMEYECILTTCTAEEPFVDVVRKGPTPRAAMLAAIEAAKE